MAGALDGIRVIDFGRADNQVFERLVRAINAFDFIFFKLEQELDSSFIKKHIEGDVIEEDPLSIIHDGSIPERMTVAHLHLA